MISFEDFAKLEIKIGTVTSAEKVENADKLLKLEIDFGDEKRTVASGIAEFFQAEDLVGRQLPVLINLEPRNFKGVESQGMILVADKDGEIILLKPEKEVPAGTKVR
jgi:methionyl-tRNA synthetase